MEHMPQVRLLNLHRLFRISKVYDTEPSRVYMLSLLSSLLALSPFNAKLMFFMGMPLLPWSATWQSLRVQAVSAFSEGPLWFENARTSPKATLSPVVEYKKD